MQNHILIGRKSFKEINKYYDNELQKGMITDPMTPRMVNFGTKKGSNTTNFERKR